MKDCLEILQEPPYEKALNEYGYTSLLTHSSPRQSDSCSNTSRKRKVIWFSPPFKKRGKTFLKWIDKHFHRSHKLNKIFNRNTIKVSYSCTENISKIVERYKKVTKTNTKTQQDCNCRMKEKCPVNDSKCNAKKVYLGLSEGEF